MILGPPATPTLVSHTHYGEVRRRGEERREEIRGVGRRGREEVYVL
jgi:hypothetical protein